MFQSDAIAMACGAKRPATALTGLERLIKLPGLWNVWKRFKKKSTKSCPVLYLLSCFFRTNFSGFMLELPENPDSLNRQKALNELLLSNQCIDLCIYDICMTCVLQVM